MNARHLPDMTYLILHRKYKRFYSREGENPDSLDAESSSA
jgi:hypothetical protein